PLHGLARTASRLGRTPLDDRQRGYVALMGAWADRLADTFEKSGVLESAPAREMGFGSLTANVISGVREKCVAAGMDGYLSKPLRLDMLKREMEKAFPEPSGQFDNAFRLGSLRRGGEDHQIDAAVARAARGGIVGSLGPVFAVAGGGNPLRGHAEFVREHAGHIGGPSRGQLPIGRVGAGTDGH